MIEFIPAGNEPMAGEREKTKQGFMDRKAESWQSILIQQVYAGHRSIIWSVWTDGLRKSEG